MKYLLALGVLFLVGCQEPGAETAIVWDDEDIIVSNCDNPDDCTEYADIKLVFDPDDNADVVIMFDAADFISIHNEPCEEGFGPLTIRLQTTSMLSYERIEIDCGRVVTDAEPHVEKR